jgi:hypothetical protein
VPDTYAVAATTAVLRHELQGALDAAAQGRSPAVQNARVFTRRPGHGHGDVTAGIDLHLFGATSLAGTPAVLRREARTGPGSATALELRYLLALFGDDDELEPQQLLGTAVAHLGAHPILTAAMISSAMSAPEWPPQLADCDLAEQVDQIRVTPRKLDAAEIALIRLQMAGARLPLCVSYQASVVTLGATGPG